MSSVLKADSVEDQCRPEGTDHTAVCSTSENMKHFIGFVLSSFCFMNIVKHIFLKAIM